jgi:chitinase
MIKIALVSVLFATSVHADLWRTAYYPGYRQSYLPPSAIDYTALTHIIHFSVLPQSNGSLDSSGNNLTAAGSTDLISRAHSAGGKVLLCVGGAGTQAGFQGASSIANRAAFIGAITNYVGTNGYDGIDIDWEPLPRTDFNQFTNLVIELRSALGGFPVSKLLTVAAAAYPPSGEPPAAQYLMFAGLQNKLDQINVMTYDLSGPYAGWVTWFNAPIFDGGYRFTSTGGLVPSTEGAVNNFVSNGVLPAKLGIGIAFYGKIWAGGAGTSTGGASQPRQSWSSAPTMTAISYFDLMSGYFQSNIYHWDNAAQAAYLGLDNTGSTNDKFISYDDEHACQAKVSYARNRSLGGLMIWELGEGYRATQPAGLRDSLLQSIKQALTTPQLVGIRKTNQDIQIDFTTAPLAIYRMLSTSNPVNAIWTTVTNNIAGTGATLQITDPGAISNRPRQFYRVRTPP